MSAGREAASSSHGPRDFSLPPGACRDLHACGLPPGHIPTQRAPAPAASRQQLSHPMASARGFGGTFWVSVQRHGRLPVIKTGVPLPGISTRPGPGTSGPAQSWPTAGPGTENDTLQRQNQRSLGMALRGCQGSSTCPVSRGGAHSRSPWSTGPLSAPTPICHPCVALSPPRRQTGVAGKKLGEPGRHTHLESPVSSVPPEEPQPCSQPGSQAGQNSTHTAGQCLYILWPTDLPRGEGLGSPRIPFRP